MKMQGKDRAKTLLTVGGFQNVIERRQNITLTKEPIRKSITKHFRRPINAGNPDT
jgi:hypothetical protein